MTPLKSSSSSNAYLLIPTVRPDPRVLMVDGVHPGFLERQDVTVSVVRQARRVFPDLSVRVWVIQVPLVWVEFKARPDPPEPKVPLAPRGPPVSKVSRVFPVLKAILVPSALKAFKVWPARLERRGLKVPKEHKGFKGSRELKVPKELTVWLERRVYKGLRGYKVSRV